MGFFIALLITLAGGRKGMSNRGYRMRGFYYPPKRKRGTSRRYNRRYR